MSAISTNYRFLEHNPRSSYKQLFLKGRKLTARMLYGQHVNAEEPRTVEQLADDYALPIEAVQEAITYCQANPKEIDDDFRYEEAMAEAAGINDPNYKFGGKFRPIPPEEHAKIRRAHGR